MYADRQKETWFGERTPDVRFSYKSIQQVPAAEAAGTCCMSVIQNAVRWVYSFFIKLRDILWFFSVDYWFLHLRSTL